MTLDCSKIGKSRWWIYFLSKEGGRRSFILASSLQCRRFLWARNLLAKVPRWNLPKRGRDGASQRERGPSPLSFFRPRTYRKGYYFYSPQSSTVIKSKMAATTILRTRTRLRSPKIRLHCRLFLQVTRMRKILKICQANLTGRLLPETGRSQSNEPWNAKQTKRIEIHQSRIRKHDLFNSCN